MKIAKQLFFWGYIILFSFGCAKHLEIKNDTDPFLRSFWGKNISSMTEKHCKDSLCDGFYNLTTVYLFDKRGNIIMERPLVEGDSVHDLKKASYNDQHFLTRLLWKTDVTVNEVYSYRLDKGQNILYQYCYPVDGLKWDFEGGDIDSSRVYVVEYRISDRGKILEKRDSMHSSTETYSYNANLLTGKQVQFMNEVSEKWNYQYVGDKIKSIEFVHKSFTLNFHFSDTGDLLDSKESTTYTKPTYTKYDFVYR